MIRKFTLMAAALLTAGVAMAQINPQETVPMDEAVRMGKLSNGMTYYIRHNDMPKGQADFYIYHDVGAMQESDTQQGLAHFLEHMAFNGTKNLPDKMLIEYLETIGVKFGSNLNAGTGFDATTYMIKDVPTQREGVIDTALLILHDWSSFISLEPEEIDNERGVIKEELRTRDGAQWRSTLALLKALGKDSKYAERNLIGYLDYLESFKYKELEDFYRQWYRPDYQAVIVVGDINVDEVEAKIKSLMADIPAPAADASQKEDYTIPNNAEPIVSVFSDKEMTSSDVSIFIKYDAIPEQVNGMVTGELVEFVQGFIAQMQNDRFSEIALDPNSPFVYAYMGMGSVGIAPTMEAVSVGAQAKEGKILETVNTLYTEIEKMRRYGFTDGEFERAKANLMSSAERAYASRNDRTNNTYVARYIDHYSSNEPAPSAEYEWKMDSTLISMITLPMINQTLAPVITAENQVIIINSPEKEGLEIPTAEQILEVRAAAMNSEIEAYEDNTVKEPLIADESALKGSAVKKESYNEELGSTEWVLKNGVRIVVKPTTFKANEVTFDIISMGGLSQVATEQLAAGQLLSSLVSMSGISKFNASEITKQLSGKVVSVRPYVNGYTHGVTGATTPKDLETALQLIYLSFTAPRFDQTDYTTFMTAVKSQLENAESDPNFISSARRSKTLYNDNPRQRAFTVESLDGVSFEQMPAIYSDLYPGAKGFTFVFAGNIDLETFKPMVEKYIGSIPAKNKVIDAVDHKAYPVTGKVVDDYTTPMQQPKVRVMFDITGEIPYSIKNLVTASYLNQVLDMVYQKSIREEKGGTYGVHAMGSITRDPRHSYALRIIFDTNEELADELAGIVVSELERLSVEGPTQEQMSKIREYMNKQYEIDMENNGSWMTKVSMHYRLGINRTTEYQDAINSVTAADVQAMVKKYLEDGNIVQSMMRPEAAAE